MLSKRKHKVKRRKIVLTTLEPLFTGLKTALIHDLGIDKTVQGDVRARIQEHPSYEGCDPYLFKRFQQILNFDKRIIWTCDKSFDELSRKSLEDFEASQRSFLLPEPVSHQSDLVLTEAKRICTSILGRFSYDEWFDSCSFGKRAAVGLPRRKAYLDTRFTCLNGTDLQWRAFDHALSRDMHLFRAVRERLTTRTVVSEIKATTVPKSFKAARVIAPDTTLGGFLSRGLGDYIRKQLERNTPIDLAVQQERHRRWAQDSSKKGHLATIDMSKASDSFTWRHIEYIVPEDWHAALDCVRTRRCNVDGSVIDLRSYMLMGSGHTFPLQTLLFYCLAEATRTLSKKRGKVSVYGDDIIIPVRLSKQFLLVMGELGFTINSEKSFFDEPDFLRPSHTFFRESCGGDYKGGLDVRPYMPECDLRERGQVPVNEYVAWCHKAINGLLDRWEPCEIPLTLTFLLNRINSMKRRICFVPAYEVDHAGIRHYIPPYLMLGLEASYISYEASVPTYYRLVFKQPKRKRGLRERPYLWYAYFLQVFTSADSGSLRDEGLSNDSFLPGGTLGDPYSQAVDLAGENRKDQLGKFCWKKQGP